MLTLIAEVLGDRSRVRCAMQPQQRRCVGGSSDHHRSGEGISGEDVFHELANLASTLTDQSHDHDLGGRISRHHAEQHALAYAAAGEQAQALTATDRQDRKSTRLNSSHEWISYAV